MHTTQITVTLGIPTFNRLHYLKQSTASALSQTFPYLEILISQNPHPDPLVREPITKYCEELTGRDSRVRFQLLPKNSGPPANFNAIGDAARGQYLMMIGDDDRLLPDAIQSLANAVGSKTVLAFGKRYVIDSNGMRLNYFFGGLHRSPHNLGGLHRSLHNLMIVRETQPGGLGAPPPGRLTNPELYAWQQAMATETSLIRTDAFRQLRFRESVDMPDMEFFIMLAREGGEFVFVPEYVTEIRVHPDSTTSRGFVNYCQLADLLSPLSVSQEVEPEKTKKLFYLTQLAVARCLLTGEVKQARRLLKTRYYSERALPTRFCALLPGSLASPLYKLYSRCRNLAEQIGVLA